MPASGVTRAAADVFIPYLFTSIPVLWIISFTATGRMVSGAKLAPVRKISVRPSHSKAGFMLSLKLYLNSGMTVRTLQYSCLFISSA